MKALLVTERRSLRETVERHLGPQSINVIHYDNPIKAMDNIVEVDPDIVLFSARDFPRHWKPFLIFLRNHRERKASVFVLLTPPTFDGDEAVKAQHLGVNGMVSDTLHEARNRDQLKSIVQRYKRLDDHRTNNRYVPDPTDRLGFIFCHPLSYTLVTGEIQDISGDGLRFGPYRVDLLSDISSGMLIDHCGLRIGDDTAHFSCRVVEASSELRVSFQGMSPDDRGLLLSHLASRTAQPRTVTQTD